MTHDPEAEPQAAGPLSGPLSEGIFPGLLKDLYVNRRSGLLRFVNGPEHCSIRFLAGNIISGEASAPDLHMGEVLVAHGRLSPAELAAASEGVRPDRRLGEVLLETRLVDDAGLAEALSLHVREILLCVFSWTDGFYTFEEQPRDSPAPAAPSTLRVSTGEMILDAVWSIQDHDAVRYLLGDIDRPLVLTTDPLLRFQRINLNPTDGFILSRADGTLTAREVLQITPVSPEEAHRSLFGLLCAGMVEFASPIPRRPERVGQEARRQEILDAWHGLATKTDHEVLGVEPGASEADLKAAYFRRAKRFHPDSHHDPALADLRDKLETLFIRMNAAYETLTRPEVLARSREGVPSPPAAPAEKPPGAPAPDGFSVAQHAEDMVRKAEERLAEGKTWEAVALLSEAIPMAAGRGKPRARVLLAKAYLNSPDGMKHSEKELLSAIQEDPGHAEAHFLLGTIYKQGGLPARAAAMFRRALDLNPSHKGAAAEVAPAAAPAPGFFKKLFR